MRIALVVVGLVLLLVGFPLMLWAWFTASGANTAYAAFCPTGSLPESVCAALLSTAATYTTLAVLAGVIGIVGLVLAVVGAAMREPAPVAQPPTYRPCGRCGRMNPWADRFCSGCGAPL